jgi:hypothetical protein
MPVNAIDLTRSRAWRTTLAHADVEGRERERPGTALPTRSRPPGPARRQRDGQRGNAEHRPAMEFI